MEIKNLHLAFGSTVVLDSINMEVPEGGITTLLGTNGSGKTSLLRYLYGELKPTTGKLIFEGQSWDPGKPEWKQLIGVVPDDDALFPDLSPMEHLDLAATVYGITESEAQSRSALLLQLFDLETKKNTFCTELSAGMRKRVALALALIHAPRLLLMDEPLNALDYESGETFFRLLTFLKSKGRTVIVSGHHHAALLTVADHVIEIGRKQLCTSMSLGTENRDIEALMARLRAQGEVQMEPELLTWFCP